MMARGALFALVIATALAVVGCGVKGPPLRPAPGVATSG